MEKHYGFNEILKVALVSLEDGASVLLSGGSHAQLFGVLLNLKSNSHCVPNT